MWLEDEIHIHAEVRDGESILAKSRHIAERNDEVLVGKGAVGDGEGIVDAGKEGWRIPALALLRRCNIHSDDLCDGKRLRLAVCISVYVQRQLECDVIDYLARGDTLYLLPVNTRIENCDFIRTGNARERQCRVRLARRIERASDNMTVPVLYYHRRTRQREPCVWILLVILLARALGCDPEDSSVPLPYRPDPP